MGNAVPGDAPRLPGRSPPGVGEGMGEGEGGCLLAEERMEKNETGGKELAHKNNGKE